MNHRLISAFLCLLTGTSVASAQNLNITRTPSQYDSLVTAWTEQNNAENFEKMVDDYVTLDTTKFVQAVSHITESQYIERLNSIVSPVQLPYNNIIHKYLVAYTTTHRGVTQRMLGQSQYYFPMIEETLAKYGLPLELKFITVIESALQPEAKSSAGAVGLWQFMLSTGKLYGLEISTMIDERRDPVKSTEAVCRLLKDLYTIYQDWSLVLASYNYGAGNVNKAIKRAGGGTLTYWDIYPYLPKQTRDYVPAFVGVIYAYHYYKDHNIIPGAPTIPIATDTIMIDRNMHLEQVATTLGTPLEMLRILNPQYIKDIIPGAAKPYPLVLPQTEVCNFITCQDEIFAKDSVYIDKRYTTTTPTGSIAQAAKNITYVVKSGDTLGAIARKHHVTVTNIKKWNGLKSDNLRIGQKLVIQS